MKRSITNSLMIVLTLLSLAVSALGVTPAYAASTWMPVGAPGFSAGEAYYTSLALDGNGTPYVAFMDAANGIKATVMKFDGTNWVTVGTAGFSAGKVEFISLALDGSGTPYVAYRDGGNGNKATVMKFDGTDWVTVGTPGFSAGYSDYPSLALDGSGTPFVAYRDGGNGYKATVMKFDGAGWVAVGTAGFSADEAYYPSLALDGSGTPHVAFVDVANGHKATVMKFDGAEWVTVGTAGFSADVADFTSLKLDGDGTPYVAFKDSANGIKATVMKFDGTDWVTVGTPGFSAGYAYYTSLALDGIGSPYVAFMEVANGIKATVMKFDGAAWVTVGAPGFSAGDAYYTSLALDGSGTPFVAYRDTANGSKATVMKYAELNHTVTFNANGGSGSMDPQTAGSPTTLTLNAFTRTGYTFSGWNTAANGSGTSYADGDTYAFNADTTLYAQWALKICYVKANALGVNDGRSWANAYTSLQSALADATCREIWVASGIYLPGANRTSTFTLKNNVAIYGGFDGTETARGQRTPQTNLSILSGDIDNNDTNTDGNFIAETAADIAGSNAYHVVSANLKNNTAVLDGFVITAGQANAASWPHHSGGGMSNIDNSSPTLSNLTFSGNTAANGGGMYNYVNCSPILTNITFSGNAGQSGGGMYNESNSHPTLTNVIFSGNSATNGGGGMYNYKNNNPSLINVTFSGNSTTNSGGGMSNFLSNPVLTNVTFSSNSASYAGGMYNYSSNPVLTNITFSNNAAIQYNYGGGMYNISSSNAILKNVVMWGNSATTGPGIYNSGSAPTISYSDIQSCFTSGGWNGSCGTNGGGNMQTDPLLGPLANNGGFTQTHALLPGSPAINTGTNTDCPATDQRGLARPFGVACDIGAYEADIVQHIVTFEAQGDAPAPARQNIVHSGLLTQPAVPTWTGHTFNGWFTASSGGAHWDFLTDTVTNSLTLYAQWTATTYTVSFDAQGGTPTPASTSVTYDSAYGTLPSISRVGYTFVGWYTASNGGTSVTESTIVATASSHTLYAQWTANTYTVSFDAQGGTPDPKEMSVTYGSTYGALPTVSRAGYTFVGWYTAPNGGSLITEAAIVSAASDHTIYAQWVFLPDHTVTFDANGGSGSMSSQVSNIPVALTTNAFTRTGYTFNSWNTVANGTGTVYANSTIYSFAADITLYAHGQPIPTPFPSMRRAAHQLRKRCR